MLPYLRFIKNGRETCKRVIKLTSINSGKNGHHNIWQKVIEFTGGFEFQGVIKSLTGKCNVLNPRGSNYKKFG